MKILDEAINLEEKRIRGIEKQREGVTVTANTQFLEKLKKLKNDRHPQQGAQGATPVAAPVAVAPVAVAPIAEKIEPKEVPQDRPPKISVATPVAAPVAAPVATPAATSLIKSLTASKEVAKTGVVATPVAVAPVEVKKTEAQKQKDETHEEHIGAIFGTFKTRIRNGSVANALKEYQKNPSDLAKLNTVIERLKQRANIRQNKKLLQDDQKFLNSLMTLKTLYHPDSETTL